MVGARLFDVELGVSVVEWVGQAGDKQEIRWEGCGHEARTCIKKGSWLKGVVVG